ISHLGRIRLLNCPAHDVVARELAAVATGAVGKIASYCTHSSGGVTDKLPVGQQAKAKEALHQIWMAECRVDAEQAFDVFLSTYEAKYPKATECPAKDRDTLLTFYDFPADHWLHIRTTNPIESTFATVRLRTTKTRGCVSRAGILAMVFKLTKTAEQNWRTLKGYALLAQVIEGVRFRRTTTGGSENRRLMILPYTTFAKHSCFNCPLARY
ncbi:MAG: transposase, partial [Pyrinomonadaceae bacterium]